MCSFEDVNKKGERLVHIKKQNYPLKTSVTRRFFPSFTLRTCFVPMNPSLYGGGDPEIFPLCFSFLIFSRFKN